MITALKLRHGDHLVREGVRHRILTRAKDGKVNLCNVLDDTLSSVPESELVREYSLNLLEIDRRQEQLSERATQLLEADVGDLRETARAKAEFRLPFVEAILNDKRREWSNEGLKDLIEKVRIQNGFKKAPSARSLRRWAERAISLGFEDVSDVRILVPRNHACGGERDKFGVQVLAIMDAVIEDLVMVPERVSGADAYSEFTRLVGAKQVDLTATYKGAAPTLLVPSKRTFYRKLNEVSEESRTLALDGRLEADRKHSLVGSGPQGDYLLHEVEIDHSPADVMIVCPLTGVPIGRPTITVALDRWSRMIVGVHVGLEAAGWHAAMMCLRNSILPKEQLLEADPEDLRATKPWHAMGLMRKLILDNGPEFHSAALREAALQFRIALQFCPAGQPRYKGKTERLFRRMNVELFHTLPGTTFSNPEQRGNYDSKASAVLTLDQLRAFVHRWIADIYCETSHSFTKQTPNERWEDGLRLSGGVRLPSSAGDVMLGLSQVEYRRLTRKGIELHGLHFSDARDPQLRALLNHPEAPRAVKVRVDPDNIGTVHVEDFREPGLYIPVRCTDPKYAEGMTLAEHVMVSSRARIRLKMRQAATMDMLIAAKADLRADVARVRSSGKLVSTRLNAVFPPSTGKVTDIGDDGRAVELAARPKLPPAARPSVKPVIRPIPTPKFAISFG